MKNAFRDERLPRLFSYWLGKRGNRQAPARRNIKPMEIPSLLPIVHLIDVQEDPLAFRHRLIGAEIVDKMGRDVTGLWVDEALYGKAAKDIFDGLAAVAWEVRPYRRLARLEWHDRPWLAMESLEMPLLDDDGRVNMILRGASHFTVGADWGVATRMSWPVVV
ncbi:PAS domain-containing protein [Parvibaculum sp.]|jgi:hypothetical protein|uniref:PAS domain-containing protein n=1 Tax=Parvibaculum sp. TaxID=2024848 RepID=UPI000C6161CE|nr:PAS domain-containing protein [Parvibaculum sp.]HAC59739.1 PAS domain-containing protein [Rhodobiaceae bacterium]MAU59659.1 PAS domain-containing protein [Parvibaculum sp.]MBO6667814.1 PAS domain-containing protein [Parvibaculum sp.]MBO6690677.1 PAS domain-containing protein [Parvibaculum sp.]MBO6714950.1 PAS domain-containing protein [Parvibaculum sp.]|tara:strand:- start:924 stop:1412 length:489 start_codon:yes stop_codon:yes gene_type:complete